MPGDIRHDWKFEEVESLYNRPFLDLIHQAREIHCQYHDASAVQRCTLLSIKTGGCPEDCAYCPQSSHYDTGVVREGLMPLDKVLGAARRARAAGASRFCMGAAWRDVREGPDFDRVLEMVSGVAQEGMEVCVTLGMLTARQAFRLKQAGLTAYNHNLDTSPAYYPKIISTRTYEERLATLKNVSEAGISVCCGGIVGMGESRQDRCDLLRVLANLEPHPESVPVNLLVRAPGTPLEATADLDPFEFVRTVATARLLMPRARVRMSAGRTSLSRETQALCFMAGANSIFFGDQLLTTPNPEIEADLDLLASLGLRTS
ncbi:MAG: biotin synthase BioB [Acidobacteriota bacterium]